MMPTGWLTCPKSGSAPSLTVRLKGARESVLGSAVARKLVCQAAGSNPQVGPPVDNRSQ